MISYKEFGQEPPRLSYNKKLKKVVLENTAAFWVAVMALETPEILDGGVEFVVDEAFMEWFYKTTGRKNPTPKEVNYIVKRLCDEANDESQYLEEDTQAIWITPFKNSVDGKPIPISSKSTRPKNYKGHYIYKRSGT